MNCKILFNDGWEFAKSSLDTAEWCGLKFAAVDLPHDWLIYNTLDLYENSIGWYRKSFESYRRDREGQSLWLAFDGVYMDSAVYINGRLVGEWKYGYSSFEHDITEALVDGINEIVVKVVHQSPNSRWYSGAGIYRNVWLKTRSANYIVTDGVYISSKKAGDGWLLEIDTEIEAVDGVQITHTLYDRNRVIAACQGQGCSGEARSLVDKQTLFVENPCLWSTTEPFLYQLVTTLSLVGEAGEMERVVNSVGFRQIEMDPDKGFSLNGVYMKLNGTCEHHDLGALGAAFNKAALRRRFRILREMGVNAIRTAHNMPAPEFMDLADEMGMLVLSEAFDMWERGKTPYDYGRFFQEWAARDVKHWVKRDRNHPSLLMWSIGNEIYDTHADERGQTVTRTLKEWVREFDPRENAPVTIGSNYMPWENAQKCAELVDVVGYNYAEKYYRKHHEEHPDWIIYGSETSSVVQSRGVYRFPVERSILADDDEQCSAFGNSPTSYGARSPEACIIADRDAPFSLGHFIWTGFDYIGEPTPYHTKNAYSGQIDTATFPKDMYYLYMAEWTDAKAQPMVHLFPHWDFNPGQMLDVMAVSNAARIELLFNGVPVGSHDIDHRHGTQLAGRWKLPYQDGVLTAVAYDEDGHVVATDQQSSFGNACKIRLLPDKLKLMADGMDLLFLEIEMEDRDGRTVANANNRVRVEVSGAGRLLGLDNGDSTDYDQYKGKSRRLFNGKLMAIIGATLEPGKVWIKVSSKGMEEQNIELEALPVSQEQLVRVSAHTENQDLPCVMGHEDEIPLRKIQLESSLGQQFHAGLREIKLTATLFPEDTSYKEVEWSVVDDAGIPSHIARIESEGHEATVTAISDGHLRVRCTSKNGTSKVKLISQLEFSAAGIGQAFLNPYTFISAGLYDYSVGEVTNGNERGVATSREGETQVGFHHLDFGRLGSDTITLPIFALSGGKCPIQIWEGMPGEEGSQIIADVVYQKPTQWNTYQEETYRLSKRLSGITSIAFVVQQKVHIKGFICKPHNRAFEKNYATECDHIYGDTYTCTEQAVEGIGNNVSLDFGQMDFGSNGTTRLVIWGRSPIEKNTLRIHFEDDSGESQQLVDFSYSEEFEERSYPLTPVKGLQKVTFLFLPGSQFDFGWFRFE